MRLASDPQHDVSGTLELWKLNCMETQDAKVFIMTALHLEKIITRHTSQTCL